VIGFYRRMILLDQPMSFPLRSELEGLGVGDLRTALSSHANHLEFSIPIKLSYKRSLIRLPGKGTLLPHSWRFVGIIKLSGSHATVHGWLLTARISRAVAILVSVPVLAAGDFSICGARLDWGCAGEHCASRAYSSALPATLTGKCVRTTVGVERLGIRGHVTNSGRGQKSLHAP
jgi:hypothetical protein